MRVQELAKDLGVEADALIALFRQMGIPVSGARSAINEAQQAKVLAKIERERRVGHSDPAEAIQAVLEGASPAPSRRRRRRRASEIPSPELEIVTEPEVGSLEDLIDAEETEVVDTSESAGAADAELPHPEAQEDEEDSESEDSSRGVDQSPDTTEVREDLDALESDEVKPTETDSAPDQSEASQISEVVEREIEIEDPSVLDKAEPLEPAREAGPARKVRQPTPSPAASAGPGGQVRIQAEGYTPDGRRQRKERKKGKKRQRVDKDAVQSNIQRVMAEIKGGSGKKRRKKKGRQTVEEQEAQVEQERQEEERERTTVRVNEFLTVAELADLIEVSSTDIIGSAFKNLGLLVTINQRLDFDQIEMLLEEFNFTAVREEEYVAEPEFEEVKDALEDLEPRSPVVTVLGHVDHGKTLLLDRIRDTNVVAGEAGGITQHIGAYRVDLEGGRSITFLDTPGHAAFTAMRARGAEITDVVILVVAADDSVMPQTVEAISHAANAGVPVIVAINKIDLPASDSNKVKQELLQHNINVEDFGGDVLAVDVSAKTGEGVEELLEKVLLQAEMLELKANPKRDAQGSVIEAQLDVGKGPVISVLVKGGTLQVGDSFICGFFDGRVRALLDERGHSIDEAGPAMPVQVLGAGGVPQAGDTFQVIDPDRASEIAENRQRLEREKQLRIRERAVNLGDFGALAVAGELSTLPLVIKGDVDGSVQALSDALEQIGTNEVQVDIVHRGVGAVNESDVLLAQTAGAVILGFRVRPQTAARQSADREGVEIRAYDVIYEAVDEVTAALEGMLAPERREAVEGTAEVRETFKITKLGTIAGCYVSEGRIDRKGYARIIRDGIVVYDSEVSSLKRFKDDVKEVREGFECGIGIKNFNDVKVGDLIECYTVEEVARTLSTKS
ncbi:MAG TPA: translation initiation factor IF-2 [Gemmatimonadetes bacterium]|nr:translation initiation factor IF-2 [Gemmatimonadota bacterium]|tara:strand:- start:3657 stop:6365 length:2709 start_codon:yes stop_codon:yes gene_type:complete